MSKKITILVKTCIVVGFIAVLSNPAQANWTETCGGNALDQPWQFGCCPAMTMPPTFTQTIKDGPDNNDYLSMDETTPYTGVLGSGSAFGVGFVKNAYFTDVRVASIVNVIGDASHRYCGLGIRANYVIVGYPSDPYPAPGLWANAYIMHIDWEGGPANVSIDIEKVVANQNIMRQGFGAAVPGFNGHSLYAVLDVIGSNPTYVTGYLYEYQGGPLVAKTRTLIDTNGNDPWEDPGVNDAVFTNGLSGIFAQNEHATPVGYHTTFDTISSVSDGPAAVALSPVDGATGVSIDADLSWAEAAFATSRELYFGKKGFMTKVSPSPAGKTYDPGTLELGETYEWQVNEIGPGGTVTGPVWAFTAEGTAEGCLLVEDFESYADDWALLSAWPDNIVEAEYVFVETGKVYAGAKAMRLEYQNQYTPFFTTTTHTFAVPQNWTVDGLAALSLYFRGEDNNVEQRLYVQLEDAAAHKFLVAHPYNYAVQSESYNEWNIDLSQFSAGGVILSQISKITIGVGDGTNSGQVGDDRDMIYIDQIKVCAPRCFNTAGLDLRGDVDDDCRIDFNDFADMAAGWLNDGRSVVP